MRHRMASITLTIARTFSCHLVRLRGMATALSVSLHAWYPLQQKVPPPVPTQLISDLILATMFDRVADNARPRAAERIRGHGLLPPHPSSDIGRNPQEG